VTIRDLESGAEQTIASNRVHPFYVADEGPGLTLAAGGGAAPVIGTNDTGRWVQAHNLVAGDRLLNADEGWSEVTAVRIERKPLLAYNLTVADFHTFFVKAPEANDNAAVWVHNTRRCNGNSLRSRRVQHLYEIYETSTGDVVKTGISGQPLNLDGSSRRANLQVNKWNRQEGAGKFAARIITKGIKSRAKAVGLEKLNAERLRAEGHSLRKHFRP